MHFKNLIAISVQNSSIRIVKEDIIEEVKLF